MYRTIPVASFTDAWIETKKEGEVASLNIVASFTDAWIETAYIRARKDEILSHLLQMRGLKQEGGALKPSGLGRIFYRCVD